MLLVGLTLLLVSVESRMDSSNENGNFTMVISQHTIVKQLHIFYL